MAKILFLSAGNVEGQDRLRVAKEERAVLRAVREVNPYAFETRSAPDIEAGELIDILTDERPDIIHFSGHGTQSALLLENGLLPDHTIARIFALLPGLWCVVLNACYSESLAATLRDAGIPSVVGMGDAVSDEAAIAFARMFYRTLAFKPDVAEATNTARIQLETEFPEQAKIPVLFVGNAAALSERSARHAGPILLARMNVKPNGKPDIWKDTNGTRYLTFDIFVANAPKTISSVVYRLDESYDDVAEEAHEGRFREADEARDNFYLPGIDTEDDYSFEAYLRLQGGGAICLSSRVSDALKAYYDSLTPSVLAEQGLTEAVVQATITKLRNGNL